MVTGSASYDCDTLNMQACSLAGVDVSPHVAPSVAPQVKYVIDNILNINRLFTSYYIGMSPSHKYPTRVMI